jgi:hypothetical protein
MSQTATSAPLPSGNSRKNTTPVSIQIASWNDVMLLTRELDRHKQPRFYVRLVLGDMPARRYGPFPSLQAAKRGYNAMIDRFYPDLLDLCNELGGIAGEHGASGLHNIEH